MILNTNYSLGILTSEAVTNKDIFAMIDTAIGCQQCGSQLSDSVSDDFCNQTCQEEWHSSRAAPLLDYREPKLEPAPRPWDRPWIRRTDIVRVHVASVDGSVNGQLTFHETQNYIGEFLSLINMPFTGEVIE